MYRKPIGSPSALIKTSVRTHLAHTALMRRSSRRDYDAFFNTDTCSVCRRSTWNQGELCSERGHVIAIHWGAARYAFYENMAPVCRACNQAMGTSNMLAYVLRSARVRDHQRLGTYAELSAQLAALHLGLPKDWRQWTSIESDMAVYYLRERFAKFAHGWSMRASECRELDENASLCGNRLRWRAVQLWMELFTKS